MSVRQREWVSPKGEAKEAWVVNYVDGGGTRRLQTFKRKKDADAHHAAVAVDVRDGIHTADRDSLTIAEAGELWIETCKDQGLERSSIDQYQQHLDYHIIPLIGATRLSQLTVPGVREFESKLRIDHSLAMVRKIITSLGTLIGDAHERGSVRQNVVHSLRRCRKR